MKASASEVRANAREVLAGRWGKFILLNVLYLICSGVLMLINLIPFVGALILLLCVVPLSYGYTLNMVKLVNKETDSVTEFLKDAIDNFSRSWKVVGNMLLKLIVPLILFIVVTIIYAVIITATATSVIVNGEVGALGLLLVLAVVLMFVVSIYFIAKTLLVEFSATAAAISPNKTPVEAVEESIELMKGNRIRYILFSLSFIGWIILSVITCGIGYIWLIPYMSVGMLCFYQTLRKEAGKVDVVNVETKAEEPKAEQPVIEENTEEEPAKEETTTENDNPIKEE